MKYLSFLLLLLILISIRGSAQKISTIEIHSIPLLDATGRDVDCDNNFDKNFLTSLRVKKINDQYMLGQVEKLFVLFKKRNERSIDVRGQLILKYKNRNIQIICFDQFGTFYKSGKCLTNEKLFAFLKKNDFIRYYSTRSSKKR